MTRKSFLSSLAALVGVPVAVKATTAVVNQQCQPLNGWYGTVETFSDGVRCVLRFNLARNTPAVIYQPFAKIHPAPKAITFITAAATIADPHTLLPKAGGLEPVVTRLETTGELNHYSDTMVYTISGEFEYSI